VGGFHTAPVVDADVHSDPPWLATAYIPGPTLVAQLAAEGRFELEVSRTFGLDEAAEAQRVSEAGHVRGKLVILV
jgi:hypothetical protein